MLSLVLNRAQALPSCGEMILSHTFSNVCVKLTHGPYCGAIRCDRGGNSTHTRDDPICCIYSSAISLISYFLSRYDMSARALGGMSSDKDEGKLSLVPLSNSVYVRGNNRK